MKTLLIDLHICPSCVDHSSLVLRVAVAWVLGGGGVAVSFPLNVYEIERERW